MRAWTTTTVDGKTEFRKEMGEIIQAHHIPYAAQACIAYPEDLYNKVKKQKASKGQNILRLWHHAHLVGVLEWKKLLRWGF
jgi:pyruvate ferredoxin oxidoreductase beta subunit